MFGLLDREKRCDSIESVWFSERLWYARVFTGILLKLIWNVYAKKSMFLTVYMDVSAAYDDACLSTSVNSVYQFPCPGQN